MAKVESDRAMAASMTAVSILTGKAPPSIPNSLAEARNQAVHQGKYPSIAKAEEHLVTIANVVGAFEDALDVQQCVNETPFRISVMHTSLEELWRRDTSTKELSVTTTSMGTALGSRGIIQQPMSIEERIANLKAGKGLLMFR